MLWRQHHARQFRAPDNAGEDIIEIMGNPSGQYRRILVLLRPDDEFPQPLRIILGLPAPRHIAGYHDPMSRYRQRGGRKFGPAHPAVAPIIDEFGTHRLSSTHLMAYLV